MDLFLLATGVEPSDANGSACDWLRTTNEVTLSCRDEISVTRLYACYRVMGLSMDGSTGK